MSRRLVYVMGPSGAGKDSLLAWLRSRLPAGAPVHIARRTITRRTLPSGLSDDEQHEEIGNTDFGRLSGTETFAMSWDAHGLQYGIRRSELQPLLEGGWVLVNGSRAYLPQALQTFPDMTVLHITAGEETLRQRLKARARESTEATEQRVQRATQYRVPEGVLTAIEIRNEGDLNTAGGDLLAALQALPDWPMPAA
jgi:ribose 1,5-bisphosphokinase